MFYERYLSLCENKRLSPSAAATQAGFNRGTVSVWKKKYENGQDVRPERDVIEKICSFFGCSEMWLLGIETKKETPTPNDGSERAYDRTYEDNELTEAFMRADDATREAIRLLLKLK